ncbi:MAG: deaminase, partial [Candidatus Limnocylindria bacterium]
MNYELYMAEAIAEARRGAEEGETPVGAVAVLDDAMIARDHDRIVLQRDPTAHAVLLTVQAAAR